MDFYKALSTYYDIVFPFSQDKFEFLKKGLDEDAKILDVGSGTGTYSIPFAKIGYKVFSFDYSEDMVEILIDKGNGIDGFIPFKFDMDKIDEIDSFDFVYSVNIKHLFEKSLQDDLDKMINLGLLSLFFISVVIMLTSKGNILYSLVSSFILTFKSPIKLTIPSSNS